MEDTIKILGARVHNLKNVDLEIPRRKLVVVTGLSGSGKSSLAFDTIYAEGQRRYMETLSTYARQFVGTMERPDVDKITGLSPVVAIEQKTTNKNPRSTVGTVTEINDFLRLLYARASRAYSPVTGEEMVHYTDDQIAELILTGFAGRKIALMAPIVKGRKGHYRELFESLAKKGYIYARIDGEIREISSGMRLDRYKIHTIDLVVDRLVVSEESRERLMTSLKESMHQGKGTMAVHDYGTGQQRFYSRHLMCPSTGVAFEDPAPHTFSFNSPKGACPHCNGLGEEAVFDVGKIIPDARLSLREGAVGPLGKYRNNMLFAILEMLGRRYDFTLDDPVESFSEEALNAVLYGDSEPLTVDLQEFSSSGGRQFLSWEGVAEYIGRTEDDDSKHGQKWRDQFLVYRKCSVCGGSRLRKESLQFRVAGKNIAEVSAMSISEFSEWVPTIEKQLSEKEWKIAQEIVKEIRERLRFLMDVGLGYLSLARSSRSLSGGESQRIRLATQIGSKLVNVLYILDEPSIGLHQRDNQRLIRSLEELRDAGNSVIVVEHDEDMMRAADFIVDVGPRAGRKGGNIVAAGTFDDILRSDTITADYLTGRRRIEIPETLRKGTGGRIVIRGARGNNLKNVTAEFPLGKFICGIKQLPIRHVVVDECQDFSPYQVQLLRELTTNASFTLVGDLMQGVHEEEGIHSFSEWLGPIFHGEAEVKQLVTSYRNTMEIMTLASQVAARHPVEGQLTAKPVLRHGETPHVYACRDEKARVARLADLAQGWQEAGYHTIAIIEKTKQQAEKTYRALKKLLPVRLLAEGDASYTGGLLVLPAALAKGLEFDCVIVGECSAENFPDDAFLSRVLYVLLTRPLHHLALVHTGALTPLIPSDALANGLLTQETLCASGS